MSDLDLVAIEAGEEQQAAKTLSLAMQSNPIHIAVLQGHGEVQRRRLEAMFSSMLEKRAGEVIVAKHDGAIVGVLRSYVCHGSASSGEQAGEDQESNDTASSDVEIRLQHWLTAWDRRDPREPHRHLGPVGVHPRFQNRGLGSHMMRSFCAQIDADHEAAYLETDKLENVRFYENFGFHSIAEASILGVRNVFMWRPG